MSTTEEDIVHLARQAIYDEDRQLWGYELLYREESEDKKAEGPSPNIMAHRVLLNILLDFGLNRLVGERKAFLNCSREMLLDETYEILPPEQMVIELLEYVYPDKEVINACQRLVEKGYLLALDDFEYHPQAEPLLRLADIVKIDVLEMEAQDIQALADLLSPFDVRLLAERVESEEVENTCWAAGFTLFQGFYYAKPEMLTEVAGNARRHSV